MSELKEIRLTVGRISGVIDLSVREWTCECGATHDRDINASKNLLKQGKLDLGLR